MISKELYDLVTKVDKKAAKNVCGCDTCFCELIKESIEDSISLNKSFVNWKNENKVYTICSSVLFYLQDLGFIKILSGAYDRFEGVRCARQKYTIIKQILGNKI